MTDITTQEVLIRTYDLVPPPPPSSSHLRSISSLVSDLKEHEIKKETRRVIQMRTARNKARELRAQAEREAAGLNGVDAEEEMVGQEMNGLASGSGSKRKLEQVEAGDGEAGEMLSHGDIKTTHDSVGVAENSASGSKPPQSIPVASDSTLAEDGRLSSPVVRSTSKGPEPSTTYSTTILTKPTPEMRGHTSYLTFASYYPSTIRNQLAEQETWSKSNIGNRSATERSNTPMPGGRVAELVSSSFGIGSGLGIGMGKSGGGREGSVTAASVTESDYGSEGIEAVIGTLSEEDMIALAGGT